MGFQATGLSAAIAGPAKQKPKNKASIVEKQPPRQIPARDDNAQDNSGMLSLNFGKGLVEDANGFIHVGLGDVEHG